MTSAFEIMSKEHKNIKMGLDFFRTLLYKMESDKSCDIDTLVACLDFFKFYADKYHHGKEEDILFPLASKKGLIQGGGPKCTLFFQHYIEHNHLEQVLESVENYEEEIPEYEWKSILAPIIESGSPLSVPLEEHKMGYYSMQLMTKELEKFKSGKNWDMSLFLKTAHTYLQMLDLHIRKEDECLFPRLENIFDNDEVNLLNEQFKQFEMDMTSTLTKAKEAISKMGIDLET